MVNVVEQTNPEEVKKVTTDDGSSSDDEVPELEEGEVTEQQKKVAEAAGLIEQVFFKWKRLIFNKNLLGYWQRKQAITFREKSSQTFQ